jgi:hypothetical protein
MQRSATTKSEIKLGSTTGKIIHVDGEGFLQIHGVGDPLAEVSVSPAIGSFQRRSDRTNSNDSRLSDHWEGDGDQRFARILWNRG